MTHIDRYYFFIHNALSEANLNPIYRYFINIKEKTLLMKKVSNLDKWFAINKSNWEELPKLSYLEKKKFLKRFSSNQDKVFQESINKIISEYKEDSSFSLSSNFKNIDMQLAFQFEVEKASFLNREMNRLYSQFDLNEDLIIDFSDVQNSK